MEQRGGERAPRTSVSLMLFVLAAMMVVYAVIIHGPTSAQQMTPIAGNHLNNVALTAELPDAQVLAGAVIMALNNRGELSRLAADLQNRDSPNYRHWLTPEQFAARFGPTPEQMQAVANWLGGQGLRVTAVDRLSREVRFRGAYAQVRAAMGVKLVTDGSSYANLNDPQVPPELAPAIVSIEGLVSNRSASGGRGDSIVTPCTLKSGGNCAKDPHFGPADLYTFYDETPVLEGGNLGTGANDCVALPEDNSIDPAALTAFTSQFATALPSPAAMPTVGYSVAPASTPTPGLPADSEPYLDIEWVHAVSPNTPVRVYYANGPNGYLGAIQQAVNENLCGVISSSTEGGCQPLSTVLALDDVELQATVQGQTVFKSSGDWGANWYCGTILAQPLTVPPGFPPPAPYNQTNCTTSGGDTFNSYQDINGNTYQPSVNEEATSPNITVVGGTQFEPSYAPTPGALDLSVATPGFETVWNGNQTPTPMPTAGVQNCPVKDASGGGPSEAFPKPSWQAGTGVPADGARDIPDVAMGASSDKPGFFAAIKDQGDSAVQFTLVGGTSIATPMWAGVSRLIAQAQGVTRLGNINLRLYELGNLESQMHSGQSLGLVDVLAGNNNDNGITGYSAAPGYDLVTGWGSPDIAKLVAAFPGAMAAASPVSTLVKPGATAAAGSFTIQNTTSGPLSIESIKVAVSSPSLFSSLTISAAVGGGAAQVATASPAATSLFVFSSSIVIPPTASATLTLSGVAASASGAVAGSIRTGATRSIGGTRSAWLAGMVLLLTLALPLPWRRRPVNVLSMLLLLSTLTIAASNCDGGGGSAVIIITPSPHPTGTPTAQPKATPTPGPKVSSKQTIPQGGVSITDGQGGIVEASGLPQSLSTVTVQF